MEYNNNNNTDTNVMLHNNNTPSPHAVSDSMMRQSVLLMVCDWEQCLRSTCICGTQVNVFVCGQAQNCIARHEALNDVIARALISADVPVMKEPVGF